MNILDVAIFKLSYKQLNNLCALNKSIILAISLSNFANPFK
ncbi:hypothetical protein EB1316870_17920 [Proteus mirabilis]|uniref:Uncharacterized protein n=1 Tax=Proteus mirabilis TaxID=584 RepID=A0A2X2BJP4_PROMI|nr:hypothetical protein HMPREF0693_1461 [Proteus mirabilis ATCC 29906]EKA98554.1 hypothetical protein HMPREF1310_01346 [Proteus mirabilis WGLW4]QXL78204.1 hypothetical protein KPK64_02443 [Proteus mirabilis]SPY96147.1 Uncharacterised protein [Proteus mirabilis]SUC07284.1 Uncharacterised protein [Proteus mirabilis]